MPKHMRLSTATFLRLNGFHLLPDPMDGLARDALSEAYFRQWLAGYSVPLQANAAPDERVRAQLIVQAYRRRH